MIQPAGYIRIMAEELVKNNRSVFGKVVTGVEHVAVYYSDVLEQLFFGFIGDSFDSLDGVAKFF